MFCVLIFFNIFMVCCNSCKIYFFIFFIIFNIFFLFVMYFNLGFVIKLFKYILMVLFKFLSDNFFKM